MPLYEYHCPQCGHGFEALVRIGATPACPQCGHAAPDKTVSRLAPAGKIEAIRMSNRRAAAAAGHLSNFSPAERAKLLR